MFASKIEHHGLDHESTTTILSINLQLLNNAWSLTCNRWRRASFAYSIWLFTFSDLKSILLPVTIFATTNALASQALGQDNIESSDSSIWSSAIHVLRVLFWVWTLLVPYTINNQNQPEAIAEDRLNKPWRPLPSGRLSLTQAKRLMYMFYSLSFTSSLALGGVKQCLAAAALAVWYNSFGGSDNSVFVRHLINALECISFTSGALSVALGRALSANWRTVSWFCILGLVIFTTLHVVDMPDQEGDAARNRRTAPLVIGDEPARHVLALAMICWSIACPRFWSCTAFVRAAFLFIGVVVALRTVMCRSVKDDKKTYRWWCAWSVFLYTLPLFQSI